jgi:hypothetical protein
MGRRRGSPSALGAAPFPPVVLCAVLGRGEQSSTGWARASARRRAKALRPTRGQERQASGVDHELDPVARLDPDPVGGSGDEGAGALDWADEELVGAASLDGARLELDPGA